MSVFWCMLTCDNTFVNFSLNVTKFGMLINIVVIDKSHDLVAIETIWAGNYEFLIYQHVCIYKMAWRSINTMGTVLNPISWKELDISIPLRCVGLYN